MTGRPAPAMRDPINIAELRLHARCWDRWEPPFYGEDHAEAVLALVDAVTAAHAWMVADNTTADACVESLASALARFDFFGDEP